MESILFVIFFLSCLVLVVAVLLQPGKTDAGALFTSGVSSAALNPRGTQSVLSKITIAAATVFMLSALMLSLPAISGDRSVLTTESGATVPVENTNANENVAPNANAPANTTSDSNAATDAKPAADVKESTDAPANNTKEEEAKPEAKKEAEPKKDESK